jgi:hypothetical protein
MTVPTNHARVVPDEMAGWYDLMFEGLTTAHRIEQRHLNPAGWNGQDPLSYPTFHGTTMGAAQIALRRAARYHVYIGMALRQPGRRGRREDCVATRCLWLEADAKQWGGDLSAARQCLEASPIPLSIVTYTGGGFHGAVLLDRVVDLQLAGMADRIEAANKGLAHVVGGAVTLDEVWDLPRILRPPCTLNHKYTPPRLVEVVRLDGARRYTLEEIERCLERQGYCLPSAATQQQSGADAAQTSGRDRAASADRDEVTPWDDWLDRAPSWRQMLEADGWRLHKIMGPVEFWTRPGKKAREGLSASLGYGGTDLLHVFTSSVKGLEQNGTYDRWGYEVAMRHDGDYAAAARAKAQEGYGTLGRFAKEHHGGDLKAAARELARRPRRRCSRPRISGASSTCSAGWPPRTCTTCRCPSRQSSQG